MFPVDFTDRMAQMLGDEYAAFIDALKQEPMKSLRFNTLKGDLSKFPFWEDWHLHQVPWTSTGFYYDNTTHPGKHPLHEAGVYYIQEASAMAPVTFLDVSPGDYVLDLCAAPGGKSTQIACALDGKGLLFSNEIHPARARILSENIERMGIGNAIVTNETPAHLSEKFAGFFDRILVDAPCSGEGMFRKNADAIPEWSLDNTMLCAKRQDEILDYAASMLRDGGRIVFSTCTFAPIENEGSIYRFLSRHPEFHLVSVPLTDGMANANPAYCNPSEGDSSILPEISKAIRIWPHKAAGEGHFLAVLENLGGKRTAHGTPVKSSGTDCKELNAFWAESMCVPLNGNVINFGDQYYLLPEGTPSLKGLKVLRPGLHLGTLLKNRFEPSHALALWAKPEDVTHVYPLHDDLATATSVIAGNTFPATGEKGWYLITVYDYPLAFGKLAGGIMKNHYPKGLRKILYVSESRASHCP